MEAKRLVHLLLVATFVTAGLPVADANPVVPYCAGSVSPVPGAPAVIDPAVCEAVTGRVFPEAILDETYIQQGFTGQASDFVSFPEFQAALAYLEAQYPDLITVHEVGQSYGLCPTPGCEIRDRFPIYMVEVTNEASPMPIEERQAILFMLSIHGNEKGGREGGFRVLEDLVKGIGMGGETVQDGAGLPEPIEKPTGGDVQVYSDYLDFMRVFLLFPNVDGWMHDELPYISDPYCVAGPGFCRTNGNNTDLNRQAPTAGWQNPNRNVVGEPEAIGYYNWMLTNNITWSYAIDIHGMLNHQNFVAIMLPAAAMTPQEMQRSLRLAMTLKDRLNVDPHFDGWRELFAAGEQAEEATGDAREDACMPDVPGAPQPISGSCPAAGSALATAGSSVFAEYYTVIDAIGYTDSGFNGDYFAQNNGLNAPGYDIELAYNHITFDSQYEVAAQFNDYHVKSVREIVKSFLDAAALDVKISFETGGSRTLYLEPSFVATNIDDEQPTPGGWADANPGDDIWDYGPDQPFFARPAKYWDDMRPFVRSGDQAGVLVKTSPGRLDRAQMDRFDVFVLPGSAIRDIEGDAGRIAMIRDWVEAGGTLVLTDESLRFFDLAGITDGAVDVAARYMGGIKVDLEHPLLAKVRGGVKQMYEPTPLGFDENAYAAPNWYIDTAAYEALGGEVAGIECGTPELFDPCTGNGVGLGQVAVGGGQVRFIGSLLPDPTEEFYHPYGLESYATTYSGNQILRNLLGWDEVFEAPPVVIEGGQIIQAPNEPKGGQSDDDEDAGAPAKDSPPFPLVVLVVLLAGLVAWRRR